MAKPVKKKAAVKEAAAKNPYRLGSDPPPAGQWVSAWGCWMMERGIACCRDMGGGERQWIDLEGAPMLTPTNWTTLAVAERVDAARADIASNAQENTDAVP